MGWQGRYVRDNKFIDRVTGKEIVIPKMLTSLGLKKDQVLMFQDRLKNSNHCILAEGAISTIKAHKCGGNVASMGKAVSDKQLEIIVSKVKRLYLALDPDATTEIDSICRKLYGRIELYHLPPPNNKEDLGEATEEEVLESFYKAKPMAGQIFIFLKE